MAEYCSFCCEIQIHSVGRVDWKVAFGLDSYEPPPDYSATRFRCGFSQRTCLDRYVLILSTATNDLEDAIQKTYPNLLEVHSGRLMVENRLRNRSASDTELLQRICETMRFVDEIPFRENDLSWSLPNRIFLSFVGAFSLGFAAALLTPHLGILDARNAVALGWLLPFITMPVFLLLLRKVAVRHKRGLALQRVPTIALSLAPLCPSSDALDRA